MNQANPNGLEAERALRDALHAAGRRVKPAESRVSKPPKGTGAEQAGERTNTARSAPRDPTPSPQQRAEVAATVAAALTRARFVLACLDLSESTAMTAHTLSPMSSMASLHPNGDGGRLSHSSSRQSSQGGDESAFHSRQPSQDTQQQQQQHRAPSASSHRSSSRASRRSGAAAAGASADSVPAAPFDFQSSTLHLLDQQDRLSRGFRDPSTAGQMARQQQFVAGIQSVVPTQFSDPPRGGSARDEEQHHPEREVAAAAAHVAWRSAAPVAAVASQHQQQHRARSSHSPGSSRRKHPSAQPKGPADPASSTHGATTGPHSSFLIQDRIHFFERYAVQPSVARPDAGASADGELAAVGRATDPRTGAAQQRHRSSATGVPINDAAYTRATSTHTRHATSTTSSDPAVHGYGSHLGSASGSYTDRDGHQQQQEQQQRKVLSGSGAPPSVARMEKSLRKRAASSAQPRSAGTTHVGFGSSQIKETTASLADKIARRNDASANATTYSAVAPLGGTAAELARVYNPNTLAGKAERFTTLIGAPPPASSSGASPLVAGSSATSRSQKQWGVGHELPPFLAPDTAQRLEQASRQARLESMHTRAPASGSVGGSALSSFPTMGGFVVDGSLSDRWRHTKPSGSASFRAAHGAAFAAAGLGAQGEGGPESISMADHIRLVNEALSAKTGELLAIYRSKLAREAAHLDSDYYFSSSAARQDLQRVISTYHSKLSEISSQFDSLSSQRQRIHKLKLANASLRVFNLDMARNFDAELTDMKLEVEIMSEQNQAMMAAANAEGGASGTTDGERPSTASGSPSLPAHPLSQIALLERHIASKDLERRGLEKSLAATRREIEDHKPKLEAALASSLEHTQELSSKLEKFAAAKEEDFTAQRSQIKELQASVAHRIQSNTALQIQVESLRKRGVVLAQKQAATEAQLAAARASYDAEVNKGVSALHALQSELTTKSQSLSSQFRLIQDATELLAGIDDHLRVDLVCRACLNVLRDPRILWPCGHTICEGCILREESVDPVTGERDVRLTCAECKSAFDHPSHTSGGGGGRSGNGHARSGSTTSISTTATDDEGHLFPNPFFDPPPNWNGRFYAAQNKVVEKILAAQTSGKHSTAEGAAAGCDRNRVLVHRSVSHVCVSCCPCFSVQRLVRSSSLHAPPLRVSVTLRRPVP